MLIRGHWTALLNARLVVTSCSRNALRAPHRSVSVTATYDSPADHSCKYGSKARVLSSVGEELQQNLSMKRIRSLKSEVRILKLMIPASRDMSGKGSGKWSMHSEILSKLQLSEVRCFKTTSIWCTFRFQGWILKWKNPTCTLIGIIAVATDCTLQFGVSYCAMGSCRSWTIQLVPSSCAFDIFVAEEC